MFLIIQYQPAAVFEDAFRLFVADAVFVKALGDIASIPLKFSSHQDDLSMPMQQIKIPSQPYGKYPVAIKTMNDANQPYSAAAKV